MLHKKFHFISGLPRSGSTLLANLLGQNPRFHVTATSGILDVMFGVRNSMDALVEFKAHPDPEAKLRVLRGILESYYANVEKPIVFDKSRGWLAYIEMAEHILEQEAKILVPVRDIRDVMASFEKLWRKTSKDGQVGIEKERYFDFQSIEGRSKIWLEPNQPIGLAYNRIKDAIDRGFRNRLYFVHFDDLTTNPAQTLAGIYNFLDEDAFVHDFEKIRQVTWENDSVHGFVGLHDIRSKVEPMKTQWPKILGKWAEPYSQFNNLWEKE